ncbi:sigma-54-dependent Fis family transcriptional regulator [Sulfitobacter porphyrae]|nr:sigma-54-dependent Fis family transcriptional regulator [Sulfitobacter porphyrae]
MKTHRDELEFLDRGGRPTLADMLDRMTFRPSRGSIELNGARMVLSRATFGADLQDELIRRFGEHEAMVLLLRLGYRNGREDAEFIRRAWPNLDIGDAFTAGTRIHMVTGTVRVETLHNDFDFKNNRFSGDFLWHDSVEAMEYARRHGRATKPVCWAQTGYAAGYASVFFSKLILYKEVSCAAMGDKSCRVVGKTVDDWGKDDPFVRIFLDEVLVTRPETSPRMRKEGVAQGSKAAGILEDMIVAPVHRELEQLARAGLSTLITGPDGAGCFKAAAWLHTRRFPSGQLHRVHGASDTLPALIQNIRHTLTKKGAREQTLVIETLEDLPLDTQLELVDLVHTDGAAPENFMLIGISHLSLPRLQRSSNLRAEFLHALSILPVTLPALAAREDDIALFGDIYLSHLSTQKSGFEGHLTPDARAFIRAQSWPGNLPELRSTILRAALQSATPTAITAEDIARSLAVDPSPLETTGAGRLPTEDEIEAVWASLKALLDQDMSIDGVVAQFEQLALQEAGGNVSAAARRLGLTRAKLDYRLTAQGARTSRQR